MNPTEEPKDEKEESLSQEQGKQLDDALKQAGNAESISLDDFTKALKQWRKNEDDEQNITKDKSES